MQPRESGLRGIYREIAPAYERVNHVLTLGMDILWRRYAARLVRPSGAGAPERWLDACAGTGDMLRLLLRQAPAGTLVAGVDFSAAMLQRAALSTHTASNPPGLALADVRCLPFPDACFDLVTISFATRNLWMGEEALVQTLAEFRRVLKPGGRLLHLETSQPRSRVVRALFHAYVGLVVRPVGEALSGTRAGYVFLSRTIRRFYPAEELSALLRRAGFASVRYRRLLFGAAAVHVALRGAE